MQSYHKSINFGPDLNVTCFEFGMNEKEIFFGFDNGEVPLFIKIIDRLAL